MYTCRMAELRHCIELVVCIDLYTHSLLLSSILLGGGEAEKASRGMCHSVVSTAIDVYTCIIVCGIHYAYNSTAHADTCIACV